LSFLAYGGKKEHIRALIVVNETRRSFETTSQNFSDLQPVCRFEVPLAI
jgi:hypothetical protein